MKSIFFLILFSLPITLLSQALQTEQYIMVLARGKLLTNKVSISLDYGQPQKTFEDLRLRDSSGAIMYFNSIVHALNYMAEQGWIFLNAYVITVGSENVYHYLFKRSIRLNNR